MMILSIIKHHPKPYYKHATTIILVYVTLLLLFSPLASAKYLNHQDSNHREFSSKSNALFIGIALVVATMIVVIMFIIVNIYCKPLPEVGRVENGPGQQASKGLDPTILESFPVFKYSEVARLGAQAVPLECAVCLSLFEEDEEEVLIRLLPECKHVFHVSCSDLWLKDHTTCPICRCNLLSNSDELTKIHSNGVDLSRSRDNNHNQYDVYEVRLDIEEGQFGKYRRWYSMGHVATVQQDEEEGWKRFTLNLPEKDMKKFGEVARNKFKRTISSL